MQKVASFDSVSDRDISNLVEKLYEKRDLN